MERAGADGAFTAKSNRRTHHDCPHKGNAVQTQQTGHEHILRSQMSHCGHRKKTHERNGHLVEFSMVQMHSA